MFWEREEAMILLAKQIKGTWKTHLEELGRGADWAEAQFFENWAEGQ